MVPNPQLLISSFAEAGFSSNGSQSSLDAIYLPFKGWSHHLEILLKRLAESEKSIYVLPSDSSDIRALKVSGLRNINVLEVPPSFRSFFESLRTSETARAATCEQAWDLPTKRSYALTHAIVHGQEKVLFIDDDIELENVKMLRVGSACLDDHAVGGCFIDTFLDTSVFGHLEREVGERVYSFLSGSFLFVKPSEAIGFFPLIYNEDWLFMLPHVLNCSACSFGSVTQIAYDPFHDIERVYFQEFGEIIAEGLYGLISSNEYERRQQKEFWQQSIAERREDLIWLCEQLRNAKHIRLAAAALSANQRISPQDCLNFLRDWEQDKDSWRSYLVTLK